MRRASIGKSVRRKTDLAICGAAPAFTEPLHVGRPNIGDRESFLRRVSEIFDDRWLTNNGAMVRQFERRLSEQLNVRNCVAMCNGTIALEIAIRALGLSGEVIVPSWTFIATAHALYWQGITPVFADVDPVTHNLDPEAVRRAITPLTTGIIGVHLWGRPASVDELQVVANAHELKILFDAAHAFGTSLDGRVIGGFGDCEVLSFHATKVFNTFEGGAVVTNDDELADKMRLMRNFGFSGYDNVIHPGTNGKMAEINAAMGLVNLDALPGFVETNRRNHEDYMRAFEGVEGVRILPHLPEHSPNYQYIVAEVDPEFMASRDEVVSALHAENVLARKYFWPGCHRMKPYRDLYPHAGLLLPETQKLAARVMVLPTGSSVGTDEIRVIGDVFRVLSRR
ncbi:MAG TPA: DegT/DnrJ/EryC1/StrS family aminotransferase [Gammaproteobacteria bacterium]|nr:DegT/DnrJ/EryC1/StrS family aminotransferase [Gammaproteobacteria bacterium]